MRRQASAVLFLLGFGAAAVAACSSNSSTGTGGSTNLSGNYSLIAFKEDTTPTVGPPIAVGTLALTSSQYHLNLQINIPGDTTVEVDSGTYTTKGDSIFEQSSGVLPNAIGTFQVKGDTLDINVTEQLLAIQSVWVKT